MDIPSFIVYKAYLLPIIATSTIETYCSTILRRLLKRGFIIVELLSSNIEMSVQRPTTREEGLPTELESPRAKLVYLYLDHRTDGASIDDLQSDLDVQKITLYSILRTLRERELVEKRSGQFAVLG